MNPIQETPAGKIPLDYLMYLRGIKNVKLAEKSGISNQQISRFRNGLVPSKESRRRLVRGLRALKQEVTEDQLWPGAADA